MMKFLIISVSCAWLGVMLFVYFYQARLIFQPTRELLTTPTDQGLAYVDATITSADGESFTPGSCPTQKHAPRYCFCMATRETSRIAH